MNYATKALWLLLLGTSLILPCPAIAQNGNEAAEPAVTGPGTIDLLAAGTLDAWTVPATHWTLEDGSIVGQSGAVSLATPEWVYTKQRYSDFTFTCELRLTGDNSRNSGIYYRANVFLFKGHGKQKENGKAFEAPSGYEFDAAFNAPNKTKYNATLGDWYARPTLRLFPDPVVLDQIFQSEKWNRMTIRARGNRLEHWLNGVKIMDYVDLDPKGSREGLIGFQMHDGAVMKVEYRNIRVLPLDRP